MPSFKDFQNMSPEELLAMVPEDAQEKLDTALVSFKAWMQDIHEKQGIGITELIAVCLPTMVTVTILKIGEERAIGLMQQLTNDIPTMNAAIQAALTEKQGKNPGSVTFGLEG